MSRDEEKKLIERLDQLIRLKNTGRPCELANKLNVSERTVYNLVSCVKNLFEAPIEYDKYLQSYVYSKPGKLIFKFEESSLVKEDMNKIIGGFVTIKKKTNPLKELCSDWIYFWNDNYSFNLNS